MSYTEEHCLKAPNLKQVLLDAGIVVLRQEEGDEAMYGVDLQKCSEEGWAERKADLVKQGVVEHFSHTIPKGYTALSSLSTLARREITEEELEAARFHPVAFDDTGEEMVWWLVGQIGGVRATIAECISRHLPEVDFHYENFCDVYWAYAYHLKNGKFTEKEAPAPLCEQTA